MSEYSDPLTIALIEAEYGPVRSDPEIDRERPLEVALYGSVITAQDWRRQFTDTVVGNRPINWYDPRDTYTPDDPSHYIPERYHFHDDIRVAVVTEDAYSLGSLLEIGHMLETKMDHPLVVYLAPQIKEDVGDTEKATVSNDWRQRIGTMLAEAQEDNRQHNLYIAQSTRHAVEIVRTMILRLQVESS